MSGLSVLYRGPLSSCNYDCDYCPFAKRRDPPAVLAADRAALARFVGWASGDGAMHAPLSVLFTPWGEALVRRWYRDAMVELSHLDHVERVVAETNLSTDVGWTSDADPSRLALWCTFHPTQVRLERFVARVRHLVDAGIRCSVGIVGLDDHHELAVVLRAAVPSDVYLWVNLAHEQQLYDEAAMGRWSTIDPLVGHNVAHPSAGVPCFTGHDTVSVDGAGDVRRCHFTDEPLGNLYDGTLRLHDGPTPCPVDTCDCHIGLVHLTTTGLRDTFAGGLLERIPVTLGPRR